MNPMIRAVFVLLCSISMQTAFAVDRNFEAVLERCLASPGTAPVECVHEAAMQSDSESIRVEYKLDLTTGQPDPGEMKFCQQVPGSDFCRLYECGESDGQSICTLIGHCFEASNQSKCTN